MKCLLLSAVLLLGSFPPSSSGAPPHPPKGQHWLKAALLKDVNGGTLCAVCTVLTGLVEQLAEVHNTTVAEAIDMFCHFLPEEVQDYCIDIANVVSPVVIELLEARETPDVVCYALEICKNDTGEFCRLFPPPKLGEGENVELRVKKARNRVSHLLAKTVNLGDVLISICDIPEIKQICNAFNDHTPFEDDDGDFFSTLGPFRGLYWRGKDCNDANKNIYPGRLTEGDSKEDTNCNGIFGVDPDTNSAYEAEWCRGTQQMGTIVLGDSASAHFHIPPSWITSTEASPEAYKDLLLVLENEFDWPMMSAVTGFMNSSWPTSISGKVDSNYLRLRELNLCNHRDYQNIAWNGARAGAMAEDIRKAFARRGIKDNPVFLTLALIGNDVCNGHPNMDHMTKPEEFYKEILNISQYVDQHVAPGSIVIGMGLVDGRVLYDILSERVHPIGSLHNDVTYADVYDYLNCLQISPCFGWLNSNETWRNRTTERAFQLNKAFQDVRSNNTFENFTMFYIDPPLPEAINTWKKEGHNPWELIEPVDGFHPSQAGDALTTELIFDILAKLDGALPKQNPNNAKIRAKFGDQGGHL